MKNFKQVMDMAGYYVSHALCSVSLGEILIPVIGYLKSDGTQLMEQIVAGSSVEAVAIGDKKSRDFDKETMGSVFIKDGLVTLPTGKTDCLIVDVFLAGDFDMKRVQFLQPYRNANHEDGFAVHRLKLIELDGVEVSQGDELTQAFFNGMERHKKGAALKANHYIDQAGESLEHGGDENTQFSIEEFEILKSAPILVFMLVAAADGGVDKREIMVFSKLIINAAKYKNALFTRIATNIVTDLSAMIREASAFSSVEIGVRFLQIKEIVNVYLSPEESIKFRRGLVLFGHDIANASSGFFCFGNKVSKKERVVLESISALLGVDNR